MAKHLLRRLVLRLAEVVSWLGCRRLTIWLVARVMIPIAGGVDTDLSGWNIPPLAGSASTTIIAQVTTQQTTANLASGASINFDFNTDFNPIFDLFVFADQIITVNVFIRQSSSDTYRLLNNAQYGASIVSVLGALITGQRFPGSNVRIQLINNAVGATTVLSAQCHSRSL